MCDLFEIELFHDFELTVGIDPNQIYIGSSAFDNQEMAKVRHRLMHAGRSKREGSSP
jgi:hypothetical protein